jgi:hypothetical protein
MRESRWKPILRKNREGWGATHFFNQGFTQKHPLLLHLKTSPGMQVITFVPDETPKGLACCACAFDAMIGVHSRAAAMKSFSRFIIFIKSSGLFLFASCATWLHFIRIVSRLPKHRALVPADFLRDRPVLERTKLFSQSLRETRENRSKDSQEQHVGSSEWPQLRLDACTQTGDNNRKLASRYKRHAGPYAAPPIDPGSSRRPVASHQLCKS